MFLIGLLLKIAMTATIVVAASVVVERSGPFVGSLIASLPTAGGAAMIILAIEHPPAFIAQSAVGSMVANAVVRRFRAQLCHAGATQITSGSVWDLPTWCGLSAPRLTRLVDWTADQRRFAECCGLPVDDSCRHAFPRAKRGQSAGCVHQRRSGLASGRGDALRHYRHGRQQLDRFVCSGLFAFFPVAMGSFFIILHPRIGGPAAASVAAHVQTPLIGLGLSLLTVHLLAEPIGVWWSYAIGLSIGLAWNALLWSRAELAAAK